MNVKKHFIILLLDFASLPLPSCSKQSLQDAAYLNKQDCAILVFKDNASKEDFGFDDNITLETISNFSSLGETNRKYTLLTIDCSKYSSFMTKESLESIFNWVHDTNSFRIAAWHDAKDYSFLSNEPYSYRSEDEEVPTYYAHCHTFEGEYRHSGKSNVGGINNPINFFAQEIKRHVENLY